MSAPSSSGRVSTGVANVLSTPSSTPRRRAISAQAAMSVIDSSGLPGVSIHNSLVRGVMARSSAARSVESTSVTSMPDAVDHLVQQPIGAAVDIGAGHDVIAWLKQHVTQWWRPCPRQRPARRSRLRARPASLEGLARGIAAARIVELAPLAGPRLHEGRGQMNRRHDRAGGRVGLLADVDGTRAKLHGEVGQC